MKKTVLIAFMFLLTSCDWRVTSLSPVSGGYWSNTGFWCPTLLFAGNGDQSDECRTALLFEIPKDLKYVMAASLDVGVELYLGVGDMECIELVPIYREIDALAAGIQSIEGFEDAGDGHTLGTACFTTADVGQRRTIPLSKKGRHAIAKAAKSGFFAIGIRPTTLDGSVGAGGNEGVRFGIYGSPSVFLTLEGLYK